jgi:hypothetical protein
MRVPYLRSVEANIAGPTKVSFYVERHPSDNEWEKITRAQAIDVRVEQNGHTKYIFDPAIKVPVGELLTLQVWNSQQTTMTVYFSNSNDAPALSAYTSCAEGVCRHSGHDLNAIIYGWRRPS